MRRALALPCALALLQHAHAAVHAPAAVLGVEAASFGVAASSDSFVDWPRGGRKRCGTLRSPGVSYGWRRDETDHCFPADAADHFVCCVDIQAVGNSLNTDDPSVARHNPLEGPITRNSDASSYSWCVCSVSICTKQLNGTVAWVGVPGDT